MIIQGNFKFLEVYLLEITDIEIVRLSEEKLNIDEYQF